MLEGLRKAFQKVSSKIKEKVEYKELSEEDVEDIIEDLKFDLIENDVAYDISEKIAESVKSKLVGLKIKRREDIEDVVKNAFSDLLKSIFDLGKVDLIKSIREKCSKNGPFVVVFLGINGAGKTTTIAKIAFMLKKNNLSSVIAAADTFRAGAQEQIEKHAKNVGAYIIKGQYGADPASVAYDAINFARSRKVCAVLVDTAGRMHSDVDLMGELRKIVRVTNPDLKILVVDALTGNDAVDQAKIFNDGVGIDGVIVTKLDADVKGGVAISVASIVRKPIYYVGNGQGYEDLKLFDKEDYVNSIFS